MGLSYVHIVLVLVMGCLLLDASLAFPSSGMRGQWPSFNQTAMPPIGENGRWPTLNHTIKGSRKVIVGGADKWRIGFNYSDWATKQDPIFQYDTLVFKYDAPSKASPIAHSVYLLHNRKSYLNCDFKKAKLLANTKQGVGKGFEYTIKSMKKSYFFACGESNGIHCGPGLMKFAVYPYYKRFH